MQGACPPSALRSTTCLKADVPHPQAPHSCTSYPKAKVCAAGPPINQPAPRCAIPSLVLGSHVYKRAHHLDPLAVRPSRSHSRRPSADQCGWFGGCHKQAQAGKPLPACHCSTHKGYAGRWQAGRRAGADAVQLHRRTGAGSCGKLGREATTKRAVALVSAAGRAKVLRSAARQLTRLRMPDRFLISS